MKMNKEDEYSLEERMGKMEVEVKMESKRSLVVGIALILAIAIATSFFVFSTISSNYVNVRRLEIDIGSLSKTASIQDAYISAISEQISESPQSVDANINKIVEKLDSDYKKLQEIIIGDPANIIEFALLIKEVDNLKESYKDHKDSVYREMERNFGIFQWFIYMNIFIGLGILGMAVNIYRQSKSMQRTKDKKLS